ncbi:MAG: methylated-DNA--[protein]-cysteine S-methyltransferase [Longimicrobiales bacterium]
MSDPFSTSVYRAVRAVPRGRIVSYGGVASLLGRPRAARGVGQALRALPDDSDVPWWRVVNRNAEISNRGTPHAHILQKKLLQTEGVRFNRAGRADWTKYGWDGDGLPSDLRAR